MAGVTLNQFPSLTADQQDLLLRALSSQKRKADSIDTNMPNGRATQSPHDRRSTVASPNSINPAALDASTSLDNLTSSTRFDPEAFNEESFAEFAASGDFNFDDVEFNGDLAGVNGADGIKLEPRSSIDGETGEKRKSPDDNDDEEDDDDDDEIRRPGEKVNKKPGRKPLTTEPTTKRKAQNRAAQRAFRERKEKHLKDLEQKVNDLEKASEATNHENGVLRAQVNRLQGEVKEYRKRMSTSMGNSNTSPRNSFGSSNQNSNDNGANFSFNFPKFGSLPNFHMPGATDEIFGQNGNQSNGVQQITASDNSTSRQNSRSLSPRSNNGAINQNSPFNQYSNGPTNSSTPSDNWTELFSPTQNRGTPESSVSNTASPNNQVLNTFNGRSYSQNGNGTQKVRQDTQKSMSTASSAASPSSYMGLNGANSSCCTSPEPYRDSPQNKTLDNLNNNGNGNQTDGFNWNTQGSANDQSPNYGFDWLANQNGGNFDPALFGDYRESQAAIVGNGEFSGGFFEESMTFANLDDPFNFNLATDQTIPAPPPPQKPSLLEQVEQQRDGEDVGKKWANQSKDEKELMTAHKIWNSLQNCPKFKSGDFDIDGLCSELQTKAKCSETGLVVPKADVEAALWRLAGGDPNQEPEKLNFN